MRRAGLDYWDRVSVQTWPDWTTFESGLPSLGEAVFFTTKAERTLWEIPLDECEVLVFGPETRGLPSSILGRHPQSLARIPIESGSVRSLNLSTAVGIAVYEALRRRRQA